VWQSKRRLQRRREMKKEKVRFEESEEGEE